MESERVAAINTFAGLPQADIDAIAEHAFELEIPAGEPLASEGDFGHALFAIESGTAEVMQGDTKLRTVGPGDVLGEIAVLTTGRRTASVVANTPMRLIGLFKRDVWALDRKAPGAADRLRSVLASHDDRNRE